MKTYLRILVFLFFAVGFSGCITLHNGTFNAVQLNSDNFKYVKVNAEGTAQVNYFLVFGGGGKQTLVAEAKKDLLAKNRLRTNQALTNISVNFTYQNVLIIFSKAICTINADIVEFGKFADDSSDEVTTPPVMEIKKPGDPKPVNKPAANTSAATGKAINVGDVVRFYDFYSQSYLRGKVTEIKNKSAVIEFEYFGKNKSAVKDIAEIKKMK